MNEKCLQTIAMRMAMHRLSEEDRFDILKTVVNCAAWEDDGEIFGGHVINGNVIFSSERCASAALNAMKSWFKAYPEEYEIPCVLLFRCMNVIRYDDPEHDLYFTGWTRKEVRNAAVSPFTPIGFGVMLTLPEPHDIYGSRGPFGLPGRYFKPGSTTCEERLHTVIDPFAKAEKTECANRADIPVQDEDAKFTKERSDIHDEHVDHPSHYQSEDGIEVIDVISAFTKDLEGEQAFCAGNAIKYLCRWHKKNGVEDLKKAQWYLDRLVHMNTPADN